MLKNLINKLALQKNFMLFLSILSGFFIVTISLYLRFIKNKLPSQLSQHLFADEQYIVLMGYVFAALFWMYILIKAIHALLNDRLKWFRKPQTALIIRKLSLILHSTLENFGDFLDKFRIILWFQKNFIIPFILFLLKYINTKKRILVLIVVTDFLPKIIFAIAFGVDMLVLHEFRWIYNIIIILLIPLSFQYVRFWCRRYYQKNSMYFEPFLRMFRISDFADQKLITVHFNEFLMSEFKCMIADRNYKIQTQCPTSGGVYNVGLNPEFMAIVNSAATANDVIKIFKNLLDSWQQYTSVVIFNDFYGVFYQHYTMIFAVLHAFFYTFAWFFIVIYIF